VIPREPAASESTLSPSKFSIVEAFRIGLKRRRESADVEIAVCAFSRASLLSIPARIDGAFAMMTAA
jgi:hypothetical protein